MRAIAPPHDLLPDLVFSVVCLLGSYVWFLSSWPLWEDQSIFEYMAAGVGRGQVLYRDTINMNWPGTIFVHLLGRALGGEGEGLRLVECAALGVLSLATSVTLHAFRVVTPIRVCALALFFYAYFDLGYGDTAQRESFLMAASAVALVPFALTLAGRPAPRSWVWSIGGAAAAFALAVKPTAVLLVGAMTGATLLCGGFRRHRAPLLRGLVHFVGGGAVLLVCMVTFLAIWGDLRGFWRWGVEFAFGPYAKAAYIGAQRIDQIRAHLLEPSLPVRSLVLFGQGAAGFSILLGIGRLVGRGSSASCHSAPLFLARWTVGAALLVASLFSAYVQGKTHCGYHYIPIYWAIAVGGALLAADMRIAEGSAWRRMIWPVLALHALYFQYSESPRRIAPRPDMRLSNSLRAAMDPGDTIVLFGFRPSLLNELDLKRPTPLAFIDSWIMYATSGAGTTYRSEILSNLRAAVEDPHTRFFLVHRGLRLATSGQEDSDAIVAANFPERRLLDLGYRPTKRIEGAEAFKVYERAR